MNLKKLLIGFSLFISSLCFGDNQYVSMWSGPVWAHDKIKGYDIDFNVGPSLSLAYGLRSPYSFRYEVEGSYRYNRIESIKVNGSNIGTCGHLEEWAAYLNVYYDIPLYECVLPFAGFGGGWEYEKTRLKGPVAQKIERTDSAFSAQALAGIIIPYSPCLSFFAMGRFYLFDDDIRSYAMGFGATYHFNWGPW